MDLARLQKTARMCIQLTLMKIDTDTDPSGIDKDEQKVIVHVYPQRHTFRLKAVQFSDKHTIISRLRKMMLIYFVHNILCYSWQRYNKKRRMRAE